MACQNAIWQAWAKMRSGKPGPKCDLASLGQSQSGLLSIMSRGAVHDSWSNTIDRGEWGSSLFTSTVQSNH
eukprot:364539-Chlamydomonas_euryale.AAC.6